MTFGKGSEKPKSELVCAGQVTDSLTKSSMHNSTKLSERGAAAPLVFNGFIIAPQLR
jgi:hypothetical protein